MSHIRIHHITTEEEHLRWHLPLTSYAFWASPPGMSPDDQTRILESSQHSQTYVLLEDETAVAVASFAPMTQAVRGQIMPLAGVRGVASHPATRRKGHIRRLMLHLYQQMHAQGFSVTGLYPFRESFYERLGYVTFPQKRIVTFDTSTLAPLLKWHLHGDVHRVHIDDGHETFFQYIRDRHPLIHGMAIFDHNRHQFSRDQRNHWLALAMVDGALIGVMLYQITGFREKLIVRSLFTHNAHGRYLFLNWLARHADQVHQIELHLSPTELPETWLSDLNLKPANSPDAFELTPMARILDLHRLVGLPVGEGKFTARILDEHAPWNEGSYQFASQNGALQITPADHADCELSIQALSAVIYGTHHPQDFGFRGWGNLIPAVVETLRRMFPPSLPYMFSRY